MELILTNNEADEIAEVLLAISKVNGTPTLSKLAQFIAGVSNLGGMNLVNVRLSAEVSR